MTDFASRDPDQLASDLADGLLPPDEAARLRADPEVSERVARIEALRSALRSTPPAPPPAGALDRMVAVAVDAASSSGPAGSAPRPLQAVPPPPPIHHAPPAPRARSARPWLAAAAAVLVGLAMAGLLVRGGSSSSDEDMATSAQDSGSDESTDDGRSGDAGAGAVSPETEESDEPAATSGPMSPGEDDAGESTGDGDDVGVLSADLGAVDSATQLADRVRADRAAGIGELPPTTAYTESDSCVARRTEGDPARGPATYWAEAVYQGRPVVVHVYETGAGARLVATDESCLTLVDVAYQD